MTERSAERRVRQETGWLAGGPLLRVATIRRTTDRHTLQTDTHTTDTFFFISHTTNVLLLKFRCNIFIGVRIIKEMPAGFGSEWETVFDIPLLHVSGGMNLTL